jgi:hypothetical protein
MLSIMKTLHLSPADGGESAEPFVTCNQFAVDTMPRSKKQWVARK